MRRILAFLLLFLVSACFLEASEPVPARPAASSDAPVLTSPSNHQKENTMSSISSKGDPEKPHFTIKTALGDIEVELDAKAAPKTVANFKKLVADGFYNGTTFHRVVPGFVIQGGDPLSKDDAQRMRHGTGGPGYTVPAEIGLKHKRGSLATARQGDQVNPKKESSGSQFYICLADLPMLDGEYTVFGHVVSGMDVVDKIAKQPRDARDNPSQPVTMKIEALRNE